MRVILLAILALGCSTDPVLLQGQGEGVETYVVSTFSPVRKKKCYLPYLRIDTYKEYFFKCMEQASEVANRGTVNKKPITDVQKFIGEALRDCTSQANFKAYHTYC